MMFLHPKTDKERKRVATKNWGKVIDFAPNPVLMIPQDNDTRLRTKREEIIILFNCEDTHGRYGVRGSFFCARHGIPQG